MDLGQEEPRVGQVLEDVGEDNAIEESARGQTGEGAGGDVGEDGLNSFLGRREHSVGILVNADDAALPPHGWSYVASPSGNVGFGRAHNALAHQTGEEFLLLLNPDAVPFFDCLQNLLEAADQHPEAALLEAVQAPLEHPKYYDPSTLETGWCSAACLLVRRAVFTEIGGFDPAFFLYGEDVDLSWRVWLSGWRCLYIPTARCVHVTEAQDWGKSRQLETLHQAAAGLRLRRKYFGEDSVAAYLADLRKTFPPRFVATITQEFDSTVIRERVIRRDPHVSLGGEGTYGPRRW